MYYLSTYNDGYHKYPQERAIFEYALKDNGYDEGNLFYVGEICIIDIKYGKECEQRIIDCYPSFMFEDNLLLSVRKYRIIQKIVVR